TSLYNKALEMREANTTDASTFEELKEGVKGGFVRALWCGDRECEDEIKSKTGATTRCVPMSELEHEHDGCCVHCGKKAKARIYFARAY
ncbi:MAG: proline--tRNA ligase, partial [Clostridia bacterium]|nr:proline--tRNA ligase [Clostridia bacterium]